MIPRYINSTAMSFNSIMTLKASVQKKGGIRKTFLSESLDGPSN